MKRAEIEMGKVLGRVPQLRKLTTVERIAVQGAAQREILRPVVQCFRSERQERARLAYKATDGGGGL